MLLKKGLLPLIFLFFCLNNTFASIYVPGEVIVKFKDNKSIEYNALKGAGIISEEKIQLLTGELSLLGFNEKSRDIYATIKNLQAMSNVEYAEPNYIYQLDTTIDDLIIEEEDEVYTPADAALHRCN